MKTVLFVLLDEFADWEAAFLAPALRGGVMPGRPGSHAMRYATPGGVPVRSIGGMTVTPDCGTETLPDDCAGVILVGAICNAASFLAAHGFLNAAEHTGNTLEMLREWGGANYTGAGLYRERQAVRDGKIVTANGSGYLEFARECLLALEADTPEQIAASYAFNKHGFYRE